MFLTTHKNQELTLEQQITQTLTELVLHQGKFYQSDEGMIKSFCEIGKIARLIFWFGSNDDYPRML